MSERIAIVLVSILLLALAGIDAKRYGRDQ